MNPLSRMQKRNTFPLALPPFFGSNTVGLVRAFRNPVFLFAHVQSHGVVRTYIFIFFGSLLFWNKVVRLLYYVAGSDQMRSFIPS